MFSRENYLRNARLAYPRSTPAAVYISPASYVQYGAEMAGVAARYPELVRGQPREEGALTRPERGRFTDPFGCTWEMAVDGIEGFVTGHPLADWDPYVRPPDPLAYLGPYTIDWPDIRRSGDEVFFCSLVHGFLLLRARVSAGLRKPDDGCGYRRTPASRAVGESYGLQRRHREPFSRPGRGCHRPAGRPGAPRIGSSWVPTPFPGA